MPYNPIVIPMSVASDSEALEMSVAVSIGGGSILGTKEITANGVYNASSDGLDGYSSVDVQVAGGSTLGEKTVTANGVYNASSDSLDGYSKVTVSVPASAVDSGTKNISTNGTHDVVGYASANVSVPASAVDSGTKNITANGNGQDVIGYAAVNVNVPNTYSAGDEGKVVSSGALVAQTAHADVTPTTSDQTIDTTTNDSIKVKGDADLVASNIKKDVEIFGVTGSYEGGGLSGVETGTIVPTTNAQQVSVSVNALYNHFAIMAISPIADYTVTNPTMIMATGFPSGGGTYEYIADTGNGTSLNGSIRNGDYRGVITFTASSITASFLGSGAKTWFNAGDVYRWFAWNE